jgi:hypothetical protein
MKFTTDKADLRCRDVHADLGNLVFDQQTEARVAT